MRLRSHQVVQRGARGAAGEGGRCSLEALYDAQDGDLISTLDVLREMQVWSRVRVSLLRQAPLCQVRPTTDTQTPANGDAGRGSGLGGRTCAGATAARR
jgi:hypothetical protein